MFTIWRCSLVQYIEYTLYGEFTVYTALDYISDLSTYTYYIVRHLSFIIIIALFWPLIAVWGS